MVKFNRIDCLSHPVCVNYLKMKWFVQMFRDIKTSRTPAELTQTTYFASDCAVLSVGFDTEES